LSFVIHLPFFQKCEYMCKPVKKSCTRQFWINWYQERLILASKQARNSNFPRLTFLKTYFCRIQAKLLHARNIRKTTNYHLKLIILIPFEHYRTVLVIFFNICQFSTSFHRLFPFSRIFWACNNFARRLKTDFFEKSYSRKIAFFRSFRDQL
jgi:hypothetical protein